MRRILRNLFIYSCVGDIMIRTSFVSVGEKYFGIAYDSCYDVLSISISEDESIGCDIEDGIVEMRNNKGETTGYIIGDFMENYKDGVCYESKIKLEKKTVDEIFMALN